MPGVVPEVGWPRLLAWLRHGIDFPNLTAGLAARGFGDDDIARVMGDNWLRVLAAATDTATNR
ncbi:membrane dipeptidase [Salinisphaera orenii]|uniref:membrane dipeptidase n=1 Tax=Salinisphaera orenii TaxID=856731 RepID=UPI0018C8BF69